MQQQCFLSSGSRGVSAHVPINQGLVVADTILFIDCDIKSFPFRIREVRTNNGHEFKAKFH